MVHYAGTWNKFDKSKLVGYIKAATNISQSLSWLTDMIIFKHTVILKSAGLDVIQQIYNL